MAKYSALQEHLLDRPPSDERITVTFDQIQEILGDQLPQSSRTDRTWWANTLNEGRVQAHAWLNAGWRVAKGGVDFEQAAVTFERAGTDDGSPGNDILWEFLEGSQAAGLLPTPLRGWWRHTDLHCLIDVKASRTTGAPVGRIPAEVFKKCVDTLAPEFVAQVEAAIGSEPHVTHVRNAMQGLRADPTGLHSLNQISVGFFSPIASPDRKMHGGGGYGFRVLREELLEALPRLPGSTSRVKLKAIFRHLCALRSGEVAGEKKSRRTKASWRAPLWAQFRRLAAAADEKTVQLPLYWKGDPSIRVETTLVGSQLRVRVTPEVLKEQAAIPESYPDGLSKTKRRRWLWNRKTITDSAGKTISLNSYARGVLVPRELPDRKAPSCNVYWFFQLRPEEITDLLEPEQRKLVSEHLAGQATIRINRLGRLLFPAELGDEDDDEDDEADDDTEVDDDDDESVWVRHRNVIFFGPPGTGKSFQLQEVVSAHLAAKPERVLRVTFHPESSYYDLVGSFRPAVGWLKTTSTFVDAAGGESDREPRTYYHFEPGPLSRALKLAAESNDPVVLIIEEINRGNCAAIFGDVFQLLDRKTNASDPEELGWSEYRIQPSSEWAGWLRTNLPATGGVFDRETSSLRLPGNLYLYASMNTSDQSLYPMDTAFRRRWGMKYYGVDQGGDASIRVPLHSEDEEGAVWLELMALLNDAIVEHTHTDDKQLGPWYVKPPGGETVVDAVEFKSKVLFYLWSNVFRDNPGKLFHKSVTTYEKLVGRYESGKCVFRRELTKQLSGEQASWSDADLLPVLSPEDDPIEPLV